jgi:Lrp/AsnC family transcriptional regulator, leucine-responsive regulatory protein
MKELDVLDEQIISLLQANGKMNNKEVAVRIGLSVTPTFERIKRLERLGIIRGYQAIIDRKALGKDLQVFCQVSLQTHQLDALEEFEHAVVMLDEVESCYHVAGSVDYTLLVGVKDMEAYQYFLKNKLTRIPHIAQVHSNFVMTALK